MYRQTVSTLKTWGNGEGLPTLTTIMVGGLAIIGRHSKSGKVSTTTMPVDNKDLLYYSSKNENLTASDGAENFN